MATRLATAALNDGINAVANGDFFRVLAQDQSAHSHTGSTSETTLATVSVPVGWRVLRVTTLWTYTNSANNKTLRVRYNGTAFFAAVPSTTETYQHVTIIRNRTPASVQVGAGANYTGAGASTVAKVTSAHDTTAAPLDLTITGQLANSGETVTLEGYTVEVLAA